MSKKVKGPLIVVGGGEQREQNQKCTILTEIARAAVGNRVKLLVATVATNIPNDLWTDYRRIFHRLGVEKVEQLDIRTRNQAFDPAVIRRLAGASVVFFTGGDQLRITSQIGGTPLFQKIIELHEQGGVIAGTSAGAAAVPETMLISGASEESPRVASLGMAPGLGLLKGVVVDSHFAERGRLGRLLGAVAQNPYNLGLGIDEDTAIVVENEQMFRVIGSGAVYVIEGCDISYSSLSESNPQGSLSIFNVQLHVMSEGDQYDLKGRKPIVAAPR